MEPLQCCYVVLSLGMMLLYAFQPALASKKMDMHFMMDNEMMNLSLKENTHITSDFPVFLGRNHTLESWQPSGKNKDFTAFVDVKNEAAFIMRNHEMESGAMMEEMTGVFHMNGTDYVMMPMSERYSTRRKRSIGKRNVADMEMKEVDLEMEQMTPMPHVVFNPDAEPLVDDSKMDESLSKIPQEDINRWADIAATMRSEQGITSKTTYWVELLLVLDHAIFESFREQSEESEPHRKDEDAINNIRYNYAHLANGIDMRYMSINEPDFEIAIRISAMIICMKPSECPWTEFENSIRGSPRDFSNAYNVLDDFEAWIDENENNLPPFDAAALITGSELYGGRRTNGGFREISGLADIRGVCTQLRASVNQDNGLYATMQTVTHELGHNLGSYHDGSSHRLGRGCTGRDQYLMASSPGHVTDATVNNVNRFSRCSVQAFREHLGVLSMMGKNCLLNQVDHFNSDELSGMLHELPGQKFTADAQCRLIFGQESYYCAGGTADSEMCREMLCYSPRARKCYSSTEQRAADGTTCADGRWCMAGLCVADHAAPMAAAACVYGDFLGKFPEGTTCQQVVSSEPWQCYSNVYAPECCESCARIHDAAQPGCEYGDHERDCHRIKTRDCYFESTRNRCCATCAARVRQDNSPQCQWGDKASWCSSIRRSSCYVNNATCCESCANYHTGNAACPYGDGATWCPTQDVRQCYQNHGTCCLTCAAHYTGVAGCEYGDHERYCDTRDCEEPARKARCCRTCAEPDSMPTTTTLATTAKPTSTPDTPTPDMTTLATSVTTRRTTPQEDMSTSPAAPPACPANASPPSWCVTMPTQDCYVSDEVCCEECNERRVKIQGFEGCLYGDMAGWCPRHVLSAADCVGGVRVTCCASCARVLAVVTTPGVTTTTTTPSTTVSTTAMDDGCMDRASWCASLNGAHCYNARTRMTCCARCASLRSAEAGCEYGDMFTWCPRMDPRNCPTRTTQCCLTCRR